MNFHIIDPNIYQPKQLERFSGIPEKDIIIITRHLNTFISSNDEGLVNFVDYIHNKFLFNKNINVFFNHQSEGLQVAFLQNVNKIINLTMEKCNIKIDQFHLISGAINCPRLIDIYKRLCTEYNLHILSLWIDNYWESNNVNDKLQPFKIDFNTKTKRILCFNGVPRIHRVASILEMYKRNIIDKAYVSVKGISSDNIENWKKTILFEMTRMLGEKNTKDYVDILEKHKQDFPMKLTLTTDIANAYHINHDDRKLFNNTVLSLINETQFSSKCATRYRFIDSLTYPCTFVTEKTWKTFQAFHPFIVLSTPHFLKDLRHLGYKTFSPFIDESYDDVEEDGLRFKMVMDEVERFANMTDDQVYEFQNNVKDILEFNNKVLLTKKPAVTRIL
jgi:hypothetical protein